MKIVLAYSGGLDTSVLLSWIKETYSAEMIAFCEEIRIPVQASAKHPYSSDRKLLHISFEAGILEDPWFDAFAPSNKDMFKLSVAPEDAPDKPEHVTLEFKKGNCAAVNG